MSKTIVVDGVKHVFPDDASDAEINAAIPPKTPQLGAYDYRNAGNPTIGPQPTLMSDPSGYLKSKFFTLADKATNLLPAAGGMGGGLLGLAGGPAGAIAGAAIGGSGGEAARQLTRRGLGFEAPDNSMDAAEGIGNEGVRQAAYEGSGQILGRVGRVISPKLAEAAVAPGKRMLKSLPEGVDIGRTILDETSSLRPKSLVKELDTKIADASSDMDALTSEAAQKGVKVPLSPARNEVSNELQLANKKNAPSYQRDVSKVQDQLSNEYVGGKPKMVQPEIAVSQPSPILDEFGNPIQTQAAGKGAAVPVPLPAAVDPVRARQIRQGLDLEVNNWNPESQSAISPLLERARGAVSNELHTAVPGTADLDKSMSSLIPTRDAAWNTMFNPGVTKSVMEKFARPTGALVGGLAGAKEGYDLGGTGGAIAGGVGGVLAPTLFTSPTTMLIAARALEAKAPSSALRYSLPIAESQRDRDTDAISEFRKRQKTPVQQ